MFEVIPAIDLRRGQVVRLTQGDPGRTTVYADDPIEIGRRFVRGGARRLHVVDLDGAFGSGGIGPDVIAGLAGLGVPVQVGGGVRDVPSALSRLEWGATDVVVGSLLAEPARLAEFVRAVGPKRIVGAIDVRAGRLQVGGWMQAAPIRPLEAMSRAAALGLRRFLVTAVERDGTGAGTDLALLGRFTGRGLTIWASGGVGRLEDVAAVADAGVDGVVVGRALYDGRFTLADAMGVVPC